MIQRFDIQFVHASHDDNLTKYITRKLGRLDRFLPRHVRESAHAEVMVKERKSRDGRGCTCEVTMHLPKEIINVSETSLNMYTAIDIVELKLRQQIRKYKELHNAGALRRLATRFAR